MSIGTALMVGFGLLVFLAAASVLGIGLWSARENTIELTRDGAELQVDRLVGRLQGHLDPVMKANSYLADLISRGAIDYNDQQQMIRSMRDAMAATPQVVGMGFLTPDLRMLRHQRESGQMVVQRLGSGPGSKTVERLEQAKAAARPYWGDLVWASTLKSTVLNRRAPVRHKGKFIGVLISAIRLAELSNFLQELDKDANGRRSFLLYGSDYVLAHSSMADGNYPRSEKQPIPAIEQMDDLVLRNLWNPKVRRQGVVQSVKAETHLLDLGDETYSIIYRQIDGLAAVPLRAGSYRRLERGFGPYFIRLWHAAVTGLIVLIVAVLAALWFGRRMARPIGDLANAAASVQALQLDPPPMVQRSRLTELDNAANAFNSMIAGLKWFEVYVPRTLVRSLLTEGDDGATASAERDVSVLFTDIRSFTTRVESMEAADTADFLNDHFSLVAARVEEEGGTVDKYIGDSVMAFWGAPYPVADYALRACRAALKIRDAVAQANDAFASQGVPILKMGIGIHCGPVLAGNIGAPGRVNYTLVGDTVNLAQRLEQLTKPLALPDDQVTILVSKDVAEAVGGSVEIEALGTHKIRGREATIEVFRLI
ncbi:MAG: HAMP domain-containing protein [Rhodospirillaceae bacterium]|nr:HAMP domain-containing protein [Rhodospirillaceae bacterium]MBT5457907.1 HAMP domain-containing protein [Rhodospirillaceae bacterium]